MDTIDEAWRAFERDGWEIVLVERRLRRTADRRWQVGAINYQLRGRRIVAFGPSVTAAIAALTPLAHAAQSMSTFAARLPAPVR